MKKLCLILLISIFPFWISLAIGQQLLEYGSNNGQYISIFDTKIYYEEYDKGIPLFLLHGGFGSIQNFKGVISGLSKHYRVIAIDSPGHGRSEQADTISYQLIADYISEMIDLMGLDSVYMMGCSDGEVASLILAYDRPGKVKKVISDGGVINAMGYKPGIVESIKSISPETRRESWIENYKRINPQPERWKEFVWNTRRMWMDLPYIAQATMNNIEIPTLILLGDQDVAITIEHALEMHRAIKGSELGIVPGAGHCVCNTKPVLSNEIVIDFLTNE